MAEFLFGFKVDSNSQQTEMQILIQLQICNVLELVNLKDRTTKVHVMVILVDRFIVTFMENGTGLASFRLGHPDVIQILLQSTARSTMKIFKSL